VVSGAFLYEMELFEYLLDGLPLRTGDIVATVDGTEVTFRGQVWRLVGAVMPGDIHHVLMYVGPGPRFIEAGPSGVIEFEMPESRWDSVPVADSRGGLMDRLHGVACPLFGKRITGEREAQVRRAAADYCLAQVGKPYNRRFSDPYREDSFYCSQLLWRAYRRQGINLRARGRRREASGTHHLPLRRVAGVSGPERFAGHPGRARRGGSAFAPGGDHGPRGGGGGGCPPGRAGPGGGPGTARRSAGNARGEDAPGINSSFIKTDARPERACVGRASVFRAVQGHGGSGYRSVSCSRRMWYLSEVAS